jgi:probable rRNA maturation factor
MSPSDPDIRFYRLPRNIDRKPLERFQGSLYNHVARGGQFACLVTTDAELRRLNRIYRRKDQPTDVLSFPASPAPGSGNRYLGDVAISWQRARKQARSFGHSTEVEIQVLMLHGVLHLMGLDHETDRGRMSRAETRWRRTFGLPAGLIERVTT